MEEGRMDIFLACQERFRRRERAMQRMVDDVRWLMEQPEGTATWKASQNDLIDLIGSVWAQRAIVDWYGNPLTRKTIAECVFKAIGLPCPHRLTQAVWDVRNRRKPEHRMLRRYILFVGSQAP